MSGLQQSCRYAAVLVLLTLLPADGRLYAAPLTEPMPAPRPAPQQGEDRQQPALALVKTIPDLAPLRWRSLDSSVERVIDHGPGIDGDDLPVIPAATQQALPRITSQPTVAPQCDTSCTDQLLSDIARIGPPFLRAATA